MAAELSFLPTGQPHPCTPRFQWILITGLPFSLYAADNKRMLIDFFKGSYMLKLISNLILVNVSCLVLYIITAWHCYEPGAQP